MRWTSCAIGLVAWLGACSPGAQPAPRAAESDARPATPATAAPGAAASVSPAAAPSAAAQQPPTPAATAAPPELLAWTDAAAVDELVRDCKFPAPAPSEDGGEPSPLSCKSGLYEQSCAVDPCYSKDQLECKPRCEKGCVACDARCSDACARCKTGCGDDACRRACAVTCGTCRQGCLAEKDSCATGSCAAAYQSCNQALVKRWNEGGCPKGCKAYASCTEKCQVAPSCQSSGNDKACQKCSAQCASNLKRVCPAPLDQICMFEGAPPTSEP